MTEGGHCFRILYKGILKRRTAELSLCNSVWQDILDEKHHKQGLTTAIRITQRQDPKESSMFFPMASPVNPLPPRSGTMLYQVLLDHCDATGNRGPCVYIRLRLEMQTEVTQQVAV